MYATPHVQLVARSGLPLLSMAGMSNKYAERFESMTALILVTQPFCLLSSPPVKKKDISELFTELTRTYSCQSNYKISFFGFVPRAQK
jgi:hypothetical protein